jgi:hypothetical protein
MLQPVAFVGWNSNLDNWLDSVTRGRQDPARIGNITRGKLGPAADYTAAQREEARRLRYEDHLPLAVIAAIIGCHRSTLMRWFAPYR